MIRRHIIPVPKSIKCQKCRAEWKSIVAAVLLQDAGEAIFPEPTICIRDGGKHDFSHVDKMYDISIAEGTQVKERP